MTRSTRTLIAIMLWLLAGFMGTNNIVLGSSLGDWLLPLMLLTIGLVLALYPEGTAALDMPAHEALPEPATAHAGALPAATKTAAPARQKASATGGPDDLTVIEGIGPKMSAALVAAGIDTYAKLASTTEDDLRAAIKAQGMRFAPSIPTWAQQAAFAAKGDWEGLDGFQSNLTGGRKA